MALISLQDITLAFNGPPLFDGLNLHVEEGERIALLGRNGAGKTTLMKVMTGQLKVDTGQVIYQKGIRVTHLPQEVPSGITGDVFDTVLSGLGDQMQLLSDYHHVSHRLETEYSDQLMQRLGTLQAQMDHVNGWEAHIRVEDIIKELNLDPDSLFEHLSGGQKRRVMLARALVLKPDVLLLDEPTNHLDIESIDWLEAFLKDYRGTFFFVTHDRMFMQRLANKIIELDRGKIYSWKCDYKTFLERKQMALDAEMAEREKFGKRLAEEEIWIRKGIKARRTRNEGRVRALVEMRDKKRAERRVMGKVRMALQAAEASGHIVAKAEKVSYSYGEKCLVRDFSTRIMRGDKIGVIGPNGSGKTTLLRLLLGELAPQKGTVKSGTNLEIAYYDQLREQLDEDKTVAENVSEGSDTVVINGKPKHIIGYLQEFLFTPERARTSVKVLSGGERNRLLLARLFTRPSNLLVMDEPTNDLDIETLELLEELLVEYSGTLLLVSHDRAFLNNVATSVIALDGKGDVREYSGGYDDWLRQKALGLTAADELEEETEEEFDNEAIEKAKKPGAKKITDNQLRELAALPEKIASLEAEQEKVYAMMSTPEYYRQTPAQAAKSQKHLEAVKMDLSKLYVRWEYLENLRLGNDKE
mgnify:CR=1 FL=1